MMAAQEASGPVAILAGSGELPLRLAERIIEKGREPRILALRGFASRAVRARAHATVGLLDAERTLAVLRSWEPACVSLAGGLRRPDPTAVLDAFALLRKREHITRVLMSGDDNLLRAALELLEEHGFRLAGIRELAPELLAGAGIFGSLAPAEGDQGAVRLGMALLTRVSEFDIGQAAVVCGRRVLAIEGPEGTDRMLARVRRLRRSRLFGRAERGGVLVKAAKKGQDLRVDLPAIGPRTVINAARAGLSGLAVASGETIVLDGPETARIADRLGLFLIGTSGGET